MEEHRHQSERVHFGAGRPARRGVETWTAREMPTLPRCRTPGPSSGRAARPRPTRNRDSRRSRCGPAGSCRDAAARRSAGCETASAGSHGTGRVAPSRRRRRRTQRREQMRCRNFRMNLGCLAVLHPNPFAIIESAVELRSGAADSRVEKAALDGHPVNLAIVTGPVSVESRRHWLAPAWRAVRRWPLDRL